VDTPGRNNVGWNGEQRSCIGYKRLSHLVPLKWQRKSG
jgi:hypothetical protein